MGPTGPSARNGGPRIAVASPAKGAPVRGLMEVRLNFAPVGEDSPVDVESFRARLWRGAVSTDVTPAFKKFVTDTGLYARGARLPAGSYKLEFAVKDTQGRESVEVVDVTVL
jgi:hypothetical protein